MANEMFDAWVRTTINGATATPLTTAESSDNASALAAAIYERWCTAVAADLRSESAWLAEVSHSLQRATRLAGPAYVIG
jgi:hypothetical protein